MTVLSIPVMLIWDSKLRMAKKLAVIGLFSLTLLTMLVAILRVVGISSATWANGQVDPSYVWLWSYIETCIGRLIYTLLENQTPHANQTTSNYRRMSHSLSPALRLQQKARPI